MKNSVFVILMFCSSALFAQTGGSADYIQNLALQRSATVGDAVHLFTLQNGGEYKDFLSARDYLAAKGIMKNGQYDEHAVLKKGLVSRMTAKNLNLRNSFFFNVFGSERYAYTACAAEGIIKAGGSEYDPVSGPELIEIIGQISAREEPHE